MKPSWQHQKEAITTDQANLPVGDRETEQEKQKLKTEDVNPRQQALEKHPKDSEQK